MKDGLLQRCTCFFECTARYVANLSAAVLKVFAFYLVLLCLFRFIYIARFYDFGDLSAVVAACVTGAKLSMKTAGILAFAGGAAAIFFRFPAKKIKNCGKFLYKWTNALLIFVATFLFAASFPYYEAFHANYNQMVFVGVGEDWYALFVTCCKEYYLPVRLAVVFALSYVVLRVFLRICPFNAADITAKFTSLFVRCFVCLAVMFCFYVVYVLASYGGGTGWQNEITWENAGVTNSEFLNEAILDSFQALYRADELNRRFAAGTGLAFDAAQVKEAAAFLSGQPPVYDTLDKYMTKIAHGAKNPPPRHVFVILSESLANWPLLPEYENLHIADDLKNIIAEENSDYCPVFLPNGISTVSAVTGTTTGLADANLYLTSLPRSFNAPYETAAAPLMKSLGYKTIFWYAGPASWENIGAFTVAQGFDKFYGRGDFTAYDGSVWGIDDEYLYGEILRRLTDEPTFNIILNASNHAPYEVDVTAKGFDAKKTATAIKEDWQKDGHLINELGHYWYAARELAKFVGSMQKKYPDSLFVIVGDHANRYHVKNNPPLIEQYGVPFIITGYGVKKGMLSAISTGSHIDIMPTVAELVAPVGFNYVSIGRSLTQNTQGVNYMLFTTRNLIGKTDTVPLKAQSILTGEDADIDEYRMQKYIDAVRSLSYWYAKYGNKLQ